MLVILKRCEGSPYSTFCKRETPWGVSKENAGKKWWALKKSLFIYFFLLGFSSFFLQIKKMYISRALGSVVAKATRVQSSTVRLATTQGKRKKETNKEKKRH